MLTKNTSKKSPPSRMAGWVSEEDRGLKGEEMLPEISLLHDDIIPHIVPKT